MEKSFKIIEFDWDKANLNKNWQKHKISDGECEEVFFDPEKRILKDTLHSLNENRYILLGQTKLKKLLFVVFTIRENKIRIISARKLNKKEKHLYEQRT